MASIPETYQTPHGLTPELRAAVLEQSSVTLGTTNPDGSPHLTLVLFSMSETNRMYIPTPSSTRKLKNIRANPLVTALARIDDGWASCTGPARIIEGPEAQTLNASVRERLFTPSGLETMGRFLQAHEDTTIEISPTKWLSWRFDPINAWFAEQGINPDDYPEPSMKDLSRPD
ncbi:MAG: hypothetical protein DWP92_08690 [Armatimonadetes bacterium]|nr:MAG: hypothetical protein DWP92_08690 [Armatimonadota bacterium]